MFWNEDKKNGDSGGYLLLADLKVGPAEEQGEDGHADIDPVLGLTEVGGTRVGVEIGRDLVEAWQRVHHNHLLLGFRHQLRRDHEVPGRTIFCLAFVISCGVITKCPVACSLWVQRQTLVLGSDEPLFYLSFYVTFWVRLKLYGVLIVGPTLRKGFDSNHTL